MKKEEIKIAISSYLKTLNDLPVEEQEQMRIDFGKFVIEVLNENGINKIETIELN